MENWSKAIDVQRGVIKTVESGESKEDNPQEDLPEMRRELATYIKKSGDADGAIEIYESMLSSAPDDFDTTFDYLQSLAERKQYEKIVELMKVMQSKQNTDEVKPVDYLTSMFHKQGA
jgi:lipopolysaccharide biosynthesis regulator YciM